MELIDIGVNLTHDSFRHDRSEVLARAGAAGVVQLVLTGTSERESESAARLASQYPGRLYATAGVHPHDASHWRPTSAAALAELVRTQTQVVAIGETGLDFNRDFSPRPDQEQVFAEQLELAIELDKPVFMHERDAHERFIAILSRYRDRLGNAVIHCFTGCASELDAYLELDLHIGITGWVCDERRGLHLRDLLARIPLERLMLETDSPYLLPRNLRPKPKSRRNEPAFLTRVLKTVAACREESDEVIAAATTRTARRFFAIDPPSTT